MCGAARGRLPVRLNQRGLSPRVRGSPVSRCVRQRGQRSIPTCAGQPAYAEYDKMTRSIPVCGAAAVKFYAAVWRVYPHVCGAATYAPLHPHCHTGLSPRVRGSRARVCRAENEYRSIPTCAGQPLDELMLGTPTYPSGEYSNCISPNARRPRQRCSSALHPAS